MKAPKSPVTAPVLLSAAQARDSFIQQANTNEEKWARSGPLNKYYQYHGVKDDDLIAETTEEIYVARRNTYLAAMVTPGQKTKSTAYNHKSKLDSWYYGHVRPRITAQENGKGDGLPPNFAGAFAQALADAGMNVYQLVRVIGTPNQDLRHYLAGLQPTQKSRALIEKIENALGLAPGTLIRRCRRLSPTGSHETETFLARKKQQVARKNALYWLHFRNWPERLKKEWTHLTNVALGRLTPFPGYKHGDFWSAGGDDDDSVGSAKMALSCFQSFFGFCIRVGYSRDHLTIALVKNHALVQKFFEFLRVRNGENFLTDPAEILGDTSHLPGFHTTTTENYSRTMVALLRPDRGYLWQISGYSQALSTTAPAESYLPVSASANLSLSLILSPTGTMPPLLSVPEEECKWRDECREAWASHKSWLFGLNRRSKIRRVRAGVERVNWITEMDAPLVPLIEAANKMEALLPPEPDPGAMSFELYTYRKAKRALAFQDMLMLRLLTAIPLRPKNVRLMTFTGQNPNLFRKKESKHWWLTFKKWQMKNKKEPSICLPESLTPYIDEFFKSHRPFLFGAKANYVFRTGGLHKSGEGTDPAAAMLERYYQQRFLHFTNYYIGAPGFSPNAMRHIVVTAWLKEDPNAILVAATVLDDEVQQIIKSYSQLRKHDLYAHFARFHEESIQRVTYGVVPHADLAGQPRHVLELFVAVLGNAKNRRQSVDDLEGAVKAVLRSVISKAALRSSPVAA